MNHPWEPIEPKEPPEPWFSDWGAWEPSEVDDLVRDASKLWEFFIKNMKDTDEDNALFVSMKE